MSDDSMPAEQPIAAETVEAVEKAEACLLKLAAERRDEVVKYLARGGTDEPLGADDVHDLRVAVRRLSEAARLLEVMMDKTTARAVEASLKGLRRASGDLRDTDVTAEHLAKWRMPAALKHVGQELAEKMLARRPEQEKALRREMRATSVNGAMILLARVVEEQTQAERLNAAEKTLRGTLEKIKRKRERQLRKACGEAARRQSPELLHQARIAAKKLRYVMELEQAAGAAHARKATQFLKKIQQILGNHHDAEVVMGAIEREISAGKDAKELQPVWRKWGRAMQRVQAKRVAAFLMRMYLWMNGRDQVTK